MCVNAYLCVVVCVHMLLLCCVSVVVDLCGVYLYVCICVVCMYVNMCV